jgi:hypothetical protein
VDNMCFYIASNSLWQLSCLPPLEEKLSDFYLHACMSNFVPITK